MVPLLEISDADVQRMSQEQYKVRIAPRSVEGTASGRSSHAQARPKTRSFKTLLVGP